MKKKTLVLGLLVFFLFAGLNMAAAENRQIPDRDLFGAIQRNNLELFQSYLAKNANWQATDSRGNTLIHALIAPEMIEIAGTRSTGQRRKQARGHKNARCSR